MNILVTMMMTDAQRGKFLAAFPNESVRFSSNPTDAEIREAHVIVGNLPYARVKLAENLRLLQLNSAGANPYLALEQEMPGAALCCASGAYGKAISEHMLAMLLSLVKRLHQYRNEQLACNWSDRGEVRSLSDMTVLVIGLGDIGGSFARIAKLMGAHVIGIRRSVGEKPDYVDGLYTNDQLDSLIPQADVVALALPETADTVGILSRDRIFAIRDGGYVLNVGRGTAIDQDALLDAIKTGKLAGAGLDVTDPEPLPEDHPLWREENVLLTPHVSGHFHLKATHDNIVDIAIRNIRAILDGTELVSRVDARKGY